MDIAVYIASNIGRHIAVYIASNVGSVRGIYTVVERSIYPVI
jgi:hypothetical protein